MTTDSAIEMKNSTFDHSVALILGGYVNGYAIIRELHERGVEDIWLFDTRRRLSSYSRLISGYRRIQESPGALKAGLKDLHKRFGYVVLFPTDDMHLEMLSEIYEEISEFCFVPFNRHNILSTLDKNVQYEFCEKLGVPYPKTVCLRKEDDLEAIADLMFPVIIKPNKRFDKTKDVFRNLYIDCAEQLARHEGDLRDHLNAGVGFLVSECVPGDDTCIYAYTGYRSQNGVILNEWIGKKLTQYPDRFGIFSSASNEAPEKVREQGRALLEGMDLKGIVEPEFKLDARDGKFKLMEINLRPMMWHRLGNRCGVNLQFTQWLDAAGQEPEPQLQQREKLIHFVYMKHEIINVLQRHGYWRHFLHNVFGVRHRHFAVFNVADPLPFIFDSLSIPKALLTLWLNRLRERSGKN